MCTSMFTCKNHIIKSAFLVVATIECLIIGAPLDHPEEIKNHATNEDSTNSCPRIVSRKEWQARETTGYIPMVLSPAPYVVVHHGGVPHYCYDQETCSRIVRGYQNLHMDVNGWIDIGYHFVIGGDGNVYEGRGWDNVGAHAPGYNSQGIGICIIGDYTNLMPNNASLVALQSLIECGISLEKIKTEYKIIGHRQGRATECPGQKFFEYLQSLPHWETHPVPFWVTSTVSTTLQSKKKVQIKTIIPSVDITGSKIWTDLIALGVPFKEARSQTVASNKIEENVVDTGNSSGKINSH